MSTLTRDDFIIDAVVSLTAEGVDCYINHGDDISGLVYRDTTHTKPSDEDILAKADELFASHNAKEYARDRADTYPSIQEQLDMQYWDSVNGTTTWADAIAAVKAQYPKPE